MSCGTLMPEDHYNLEVTMCGVAGAIGVPQASEAVRTMMHALQNRGQQAAGIISLENDTFHEHHSAGTVANDIPQEELNKLCGDIAIGHNRYATALNSDGPRNMQPFLLKSRHQPIGLAHNGNFTNAEEIEEKYLIGTPFGTDSDTERFFRLILRSYRDEKMVPSIISALKKAHGSCSAVLTLPSTLIAIRDSSGCRPLFWGRYKGGFVVASENCALDALEVFDYKEVPPGTIVEFNQDGTYAITEFGDGVRHFCSFELVYFGQVTSTLYDIHVADIREAWGRQLAIEHPVETDLIVGIPDSGNLGACGYGYRNINGSYTPNVILRRHNTGRTFIKAGQAKRERGVDDKFSFTSAKINGKRIVVVDDSLVRGTTSRRITASLRKRGAIEVHWRIAAPPVTGGCRYGIATRDGELLAAKMTKDEMCRDIGADSLEFLSMEGFRAVLSEHSVPANQFCFACLDGKYW